MLARSHGLNAPARKSVGTTLAPRVRLPAWHHRSYCACQAAQQDGKQHTRGAVREACLSVAGAAALSALLVLGPVQPSSAAEIGALQQQQQQQQQQQGQATASPFSSLAKPLQKQPVDKGRVWTVLVGGAVVLFSLTLTAENYEAFFPAIAKANKAMALGRKKAEKEERDQARFQEAEAQAEVVKEQSATAVEEGMALARQKMLAQQQEQLLQSSLPSPQGSTSFPAQLDSNVDSPSPTTNSSSNGNSSSSSSSSSSNSSSSNSNRSMNDEDAPPPNGMSPSSSSSSEPAAQSVAQDQEGSTPPELTSSEAQAGQDQPSPTGSSSGGGSSSRALTNEEINAARTMRMQGEAPRGEAQGAAGSASASAAALQPGAPAGDDGSAAAAAAAVAVAVGSSASKTARLESFVGGMMKEGDRAGFLSGMKGRTPRS